MGGSIGIVIAENEAERIDRLIIAEPNLDPGPGMVSGPISSQSEEEFVSGGYADFLAGIMTADLPDYAGTVQAADPLALHRSAVSLIAERRPTFREILLSLTVPRTYIVGERNLPDQRIESLAKEGIAVRIVPNAGHDMINDNPDGFAAAIAESLG